MTTAARLRSSCARNGATHALTSRRQLRLSTSVRSSAGTSTESMDGNRRRAPEPVQVTSRQGAGPQRGCFRDEERPSAECGRALSVDKCWGGAAGSTHAQPWVGCVQQKRRFGSAGSFGRLLLGFGSVVLRNATERHLEFCRGVLRDWASRLPNRRFCCTRGGENVRRPSRGPASEGAGWRAVASRKLVYQSVFGGRSLPEKNGHRLESSITTKDRFEGRRCPLWTLYYSTTPK